jgi:hypothetical protein
MVPIAGGSACEATLIGDANLSISIEMLARRSLFFTSIAY